MAVGCHGYIILTCQDNPLRVRQRAQCRGNTASVANRIVSPSGTFRIVGGPTLGLFASQMEFEEFGSI
jgi:hypothetical protein